MELASAFCLATVVDQKDVDELRSIVRGIRRPPIFSDTSGQPATTFCLRIARAAGLPPRALLPAELYFDAAFVPMRKVVNHA